MVRDNREAETEMERRRRRRKAEKLRGLKRRRRRLVLAILAVLFLPIIGARIYFGVNPVILKNSVIDVELKDSVNLKKNIRYVFAGKASQVKITGSVDNTKEGDYRVTYSWRGRKKTVTVKVRDTKPPVLEMKNSYTVDLGGAVTADDFVKKVKDASEVSLKILNAKKWDKAGEYSISVEAKDIYGNKTTGKSKLILEEDKTPPEISGAEDTEILQGKTMDFSSGVTVKDNADPDPSLSVDSTKADLNTPGTYVVTYVAKDRSGNETKVERKITVKANPEWKEKIVYLTFDDGPSENTGKILDILKQYNIKGTFFVTGNHREHDDLIKRAFDEGNSIGLHTYTHDYATVYASEQAYFDDLQKVSDLVEKITGEKSTLIRFPGGSSNTVSADYVQGLMTTLTKAVHEKGYEYFDWNCDSTDASGNNVAVSKLVQNATLCSADHVTIYVVTYVAKDRSGNETKVERKITVKANPEWKEKIVYLTFDDGPSENTGKILDILKQYNIKGTFFVTGNHREHDDLIKRAFDEGNSIGLHTYTHDYATVYASEQAYFDDLQKVSDLVEKITGEKSTLIRFPGGSSNTVSADYVQGLMTTLTKAVHEKGYEYFDWNCDSTDASGNNVAVSKLVQNATLCSADHVTILMHDTDAKDTTVEALPQIIEYYRGQGYSFKGLTKDSVAAHHRVNN